MTTPPDGWLICNGQSTVGYPALAAVVGSKVPDLRGEFVRGLDLERGVDSGRVFGSSQIPYAGYFNFKFTVDDGDDRTGTQRSIYGIGFQDTFFTGSNYTKFTGSSMKVQITPEDTRPRNVALLPCIKY